MDSNHYRCEKCDKKVTKAKKIKSRSKPVPPPADNQQETVSIKIRKVQGEVMVVSEESGVREEFGSTDTDEYKID